MFNKSQTLAKVDSDIANAITKEEVRQETHIELIASENHTSPAVMEAQGSQLIHRQHTASHRSDWLSARVFIKTYSTTRALALEKSSNEKVVLYSVMLT
jgi:glycine hydroxymethyltransferase